MSILQHEIIDSFETDEEHIYLVAVDDLEWSEGQSFLDDHEHIIHLRKKLLYYFHFVQNGDLALSREDAQNKKVILRLDSLFSPNFYGFSFLAHVERTVEIYDLELTYKLLS